MVSVHLEERAVGSEPQIEVLIVEAVIGENNRRLIVEATRYRRWHSRWRQTVSLQPVLSFIGGRRVEVKADKKIGPVLFGKVDAIGKGQICVISACKENGPAIGFEQKRQPARPIQRVIFFVGIAPCHASSAGVFSAMPWVDDNHAVEARN